jgi:hypothetical protein
VEILGITTNTWTLIKTYSTVPLNTPLFCAISLILVWNFVAAGLHRSFR